MTSDQDKSNAGRHQDDSRRPQAPTGHADEKLRAARLWIMLNRPYYARALFACQLLSTTAVESMTIDTQWRIYSNPNYLESTGVAEVAAHIVHNLNHALRNHAARSTALSVQARMGNVWNVACCCEIDDDLVADGLSLPDDLPFPYMYSLNNGETAEKYYKNLIDSDFVEWFDLDLSEVNIEGYPSCGSAADGFPGSYELDEATLSPVEQELLRHSTAQAIRDFAESQTPGTVPAGLFRWASARLEPKVNWRKVLASTVRRSLHQKRGTADYSWKRLPRRQDLSSRMLRPGTILPVPSLAVVVDTSGSMSEDDLSSAMAEVEAILTRVVPGYAINLVTVDAEVQASSRILTRRGIELKGGGGTDMRVGIEEAARSRPAAIIVLTDGFTPWPTRRPPHVNKVIATLVATRDPRQPTRPVPAPTSRVPAWIETIVVDDLNKGS